MGCMLPFRHLQRKLVYETEGLRALARYALNAERVKSRVAGRFEVLSLELTNVCNANCVFCAYQHQERATGIMPDALFLKVVREFVEQGGGAINLTPTVGDPLIDPALVSRIAFLRSHPQLTSIGMYSNFISMQRFGPAHLIDAGVSQIVVSMSGPEDGMYRRVYRSKMYPKVLSNILAFAEENNRRGRPVAFSIDMRIDRPLSEVTQLADYKRLEDALGPGGIGVKYRYDDWAGKIAQKDLSGTMKLRRKPRIRRPRISPCSALYWSPMVYWDGSVGACACRDVNASELIIGNAYQQTLEEIWHGEPLAKIRRDFLTPSCPTICRGCTHYNNLSIYARTDSK